MRASKRARKAWTVSAVRCAVVGFRLALRIAAGSNWDQHGGRSEPQRVGQPHLRFRRGLAPRLLFIQAHGYSICRDDKSHRSGLADLKDNCSNHDNTLQLMIR